MNETTTTKLNEEQVKLLRNLGRNNVKNVRVETLVVNYYSDKGYDIYVCASTRVDGAEFNYSDLRFPFPAIGHSEVYSGQERQRIGEEPAYPVRFVGQAPVSYVGERASALLSIAHLVKAGDQLHIKFVIGNSTKYLNDAGLQQDEAYISIVRGGQFVATFPVDFRVTPIGSLAGMTDRSYRGAQS